MTFVSLVLIQFFKAYNFRSDRHSVLRRPFANKWLNIAIVWELFMLGLILYVPFLERVFGTFELPLMDWVIIVGGGLYRLAGPRIGQVDGTSRLVWRTTLEAALYPARNTSVKLVVRVIDATPETCGRLTGYEAGQPPLAAPVFTQALRAINVINKAVRLGSDSVSNTSG